MTLFVLVLYKVTNTLVLCHLSVFILPGNYSILSIFRRKYLNFVNKSSRYFCPFSIRCWYFSFADLFKSTFLYLESKILHTDLILMHVISNLKYSSIYAYIRYSLHFSLSRFKFVVFIFPKLPFFGSCNSNYQSCKYIPNQYHSIPNLM